MRLVVVCAWCGRVEPREGSPEGTDAVVELSTPAPDARVTHTICDRCYVREAAQVERIVRARRQQKPAKPA